MGVRRVAAVAPALVGARACLTRAVNPEGVRGAWSPAAAVRQARRCATLTGSGPAARGRLVWPFSRVLSARPTRPLLRSGQGRFRFLGFELERDRDRDRGRDRGRGCSVTAAWACEGAVLGGVRRQARGCDVAVERGPAGGQLSFRDARGGVPRTRRPEQPLC